MGTLEQTLFTKDQPCPSHINVVKFFLLFLLVKTIETLKDYSLFHLSSVDSEQLIPGPRQTLRPFLGRGEGV